VLNKGGRGGGLCGGLQRGRGGGEGGEGGEKRAIWKGRKRMETSIEIESEGGWTNKKAGESESQEKSVEAGRWGVVRMNRLTEGPTDRRRDRLTVRLTEWIYDGRADMPCVGLHGWLVGWTETWVEAKKDRRIGGRKFSRAVRSVERDPQLGT
jgi:hypothetical protein